MPEDKAFFTSNNSCDRTERSYGRTGGGVGLSQICAGFKFCRALQGRSQSQKKQARLVAAEKSA